MELETARIKTRDYDDGLMKCEETLISEVRSPLPKLLYVGVGAVWSLEASSSRDLVLGATLPYKPPSFPQTVAGLPWKAH